MKKKSTLRDVARQSGVSVATVSRVLNDSQSVTEKTRVRVSAAIEDLGFVPSAAARSLNSGRTRTIGALVPTLDHSIFARYLNALEDRLSELGYGLIVSVTNGSGDIEVKKAHNLLDMGVEGVIVSGRSHAEGLNRLLRRFDVPMIITSYFDPLADYPTIGYNNAAIAESALRYLRDLNHRHVAVLHGPLEGNDRIEARLDGLKRAQGDVTLEFVETELSVKGGAEGILQAKIDRQSTTAVLCLSDVQALGALFELQRQKISVPQDVSLMGFDNLEWSSISNPGITSIALPAAKMGLKAAEAMASWLTTNFPAEPLDLKAEIVSRGSTRKI